MSPTENQKDQQMADELRGPTPNVILEINIKAFDNADVEIAFPKGSNVWVLRGILAKALDRLNLVTATPEQKPEPVNQPPGGNPAPESIRSAGNG